MSAEEVSKDDTQPGQKEPEDQAVAGKSDPPNEPETASDATATPNEADSGGGGSMVVLGATLQEDSDEPDLDSLPELPQSNPPSLPATRPPTSGSDQPLPATRPPISGGYQSLLAPRPPLPDPGDQSPSSFYGIPPKEVIIRNKIEAQNRYIRWLEQKKRAKELSDEAKKTAETQSRAQPSPKKAGEGVTSKSSPSSRAKSGENAKEEDVTGSGGAETNLETQTQPRVRFSLFDNPAVRPKTAKRQKSSKKATDRSHGSTVEWSPEDSRSNYHAFLSRQFTLVKDWTDEFFLAHPRYIQVFTIFLILYLSFRFLEPVPTLLDEPKAPVHQRVFGEDISGSLNTTLDEFTTDPASRRLILQRRFRQAQTLAVDTLHRAAEVSDYCLALKHAPSVFEPHLAPQPKPDPKFQYLPRWTWPKDSPRPHDLAPLSDGLRKLESLLNPRVEGPGRGPGGGKKPQKPSGSTSTSTSSVRQSLPLAFAAIDKFGTTLHDLATEHAVAIRVLNGEIEAANQGASTRGMWRNPFAGAARRRQSATARKAAALAAFYRDTSRTVLERARVLKAARSRADDAIAANAAFVHGPALKAVVRRFGHAVAAGSSRVPRVVGGFLRPLFLGGSSSSSTSSSRLVPSTYAQLREIVAVTRDLGNCGAALDDLEWTLSALGAVTARVAEMIELAGGAALDQTGVGSGSGSGSGGGIGISGGGKTVFSEEFGGLLDLETSTASSLSGAWSWALADVPLLFPLLVIEPHVSYRQAEMAKWRDQDSRV